MSGNADNMGEAGTAGSCTANGGFLPGTSDRKQCRNHKFASALRFPKFMSEAAAMSDEVRKAGTSAANLKFLSVSQQVLDRNFKFKAALETISC